MRPNVKRVSVFAALAWLLISSSSLGQEPADPQNKDKVQMPSSKANGTFLIDTAPESDSIPILLSGRVHGLILDDLIKASGAAPSPVRVMITIVPTPIRMPEGSCVATFDISSYDEKIPATKLLAELPEVLPETLYRLDPNPKRIEAEVSQLGQTLDRLKGQFAQTSKNYEARSSQLGAITPEQATAISIQRRQELISLRGLEARYEALLKRIADLSASVDQSTASDPVLKELDKAISIREQQRERLAKSKAQGVASANEIREAELALAKARVDSATYRRSATTATSRLAELQRHMDETTISIAEQKAKVDQLGEVQGETEYFELRVMRAEIDSLLTVIGDLQSKLVNKQLELDSYRLPTVTPLTKPPEGEQAK